MSRYKLNQKKILYHEDYKKIGVLPLSSLDIRGCQWALHLDLVAQIFRHADAEEPNLYTSLLWF